MSLRQACLMFIAKNASGELLFAAWVQREFNYGYITSQMIVQKLASEGLVTGTNAGYRLTALGMAEMAKGASA